MSARGNLRIPSVILLVLIVVKGLAFASGQREDQLATAEQLINEKKYNDAILVITEVMKKHPEEFDRAQALLAKIDKARRTYNDKVAELIRVFNEGNLEQAYKIIKELETLDKAPNQRTLESQAYARQTVTYVYDTNRFQSIMNKAASLLDAGSYGDAISTYVSGFDIGLDLFKQANYGNIVTDKVDAIRSDMKAAAEQYVAALRELDAERNSITADLPKTDRLTTDVDSLLANLRKISGLKRRIDRDTTNLKIQRESIVIQRNSQQDVPLISFLDRIVHGRSDVTKPEGILATIDQSWRGSVNAVYTELEKQAVDHLARGKTGFEAHRWNDAVDEFSAAQSYAGLAGRAGAAWGAQLTVGQSLALPADDWTVIERELPRVLADQAMARAAGGYVSLVADARTSSEITTAVASTTDSIEALATQRRRADSVAVKLGDLRSKWEGIRSEYTHHASDKIDVTSTLRVIDGLLSSVDAVLAESNQTNINILAREGSLRLSPIQQQVAETKKSVEEATQLMTGMPAQKGGGTVSTTPVVLEKKYPARALQLLTTTHGELEQYSQTLSAAEGFLSSGSPTVLDAPAVKSVMTTADELTKEIASLKEKVDTSITQAKQQLFQANRYRQQGENRLQMARNDMARNQLSTARQEIAAAANSFDMSLSFQENADVRKVRDVQLPQLSSQISNEENTVVVHVVRDYINRGREFYSQGNYAQAQEMFLRAESRWKTTNTESNPEITTWLQYVNTALTINSGRVVSETDPLYPEVTQVLNLAREDYRKADQLLPEGKAEQAQSLLKEAQKKLIYVQIPFPLNKEARVLALKILKLNDPKGFAATFKKKYDQAVAELTTSPQESYVSLKDLQAIDPNYQEIGQVLNRAEILLGMRRPPPDPAKIKESEDLYQKAFDIVRQNVRAQYPIALSYLNRAIELDPNNQKAATLKDRIATDQGAETTVVLSSADQVRFKLAQEQFIAKSYYEALRTVNQLLKDPANQKYSPLLELKRRIESKI